jgi:hypothetical protein
MWAGTKFDHKPLFAPGRHILTLSEIQSICVTSFTQNVRRAHLFHKFEEFFQTFLVSGIQGEVWVNGSFITEKPEPEDIDATVIIPAFGGAAGITVEQRSLIDLTNNGDFGSEVDGFAWEWLPKDHPDYDDESRNPALTWHHQYGVENSGEWLKGFVVARLR